MIKQLFPLVLCYALMTSQLFALSGGPIFTSGVSVTGTYSGTIAGVTETDNSSSSGPAIPGDPVPPVNNSNTTPSNALGLFALGVPTTNLATGAFLLFADGRVFTGTINASVDPDSAKLSGVLEGTFNFTLETFNAAGDVVSTPITADATGKINATIRSSRQRAVTAARLTGTASLNIDFGQVDATTFAPIITRSITFTVSGFQQSSVAAGSTTISTGT